MMHKIVTGLLLLLVGCFVCEGKICHENKISDIFHELTYEMEMIEKERQKCSQTNETESDRFCSQVFDGIMCWPPVQAGTISVQDCPTYMSHRVPNGTASKYCQLNGEWFVHPVHNKTWTNLSGCFDPDKKMDLSVMVPQVVQKHLKYIKILYDIGYSISLMSLVIAVFIMTCFRRLRCQRNTIHINMFVSFIFRSVICYMKDIYVLPEIESVELPEDSDRIVAFGQSAGCKAVYTLFYYTVSTNFMWIFVEGIYMHTFVLSTKYNVPVRFYHTLLVFGWGFPVTFVIPWLVVRWRHENTLCWSTHDLDNGYYWIIKGPITATIVINFIFFINIIRVLYTKLSAAHNRNPKRYRKLTKSTLILIPLFGVYYIVFIAIPVCMEPVYEVIWMYTEMFFNSFQGFAVAILFCFINEEVKREMSKFKRKHKRKLRRGSHYSNKLNSRSGYQSDHEAPTSPNHDTLQLDETHKAENNKNGQKMTYASINNGHIHSESEEMLST